MEGLRAACGASRGTRLAVYTGGALSGVTLSQIGAGATFTCALASTGAAYCWGRDTGGQLGNGSSTNSSVPVTVVGIIPGAPTGDTTATIAWTAPSSFGTGTLTGYAATATPGGFSCSTASSLTCQITGLTDGTTYTVTVVTQTADGGSPPSSSVTVVPAGSLTLTSPASLAWAATGNGSNQASVDTTAADQQLTVTDNTGTGAGWHITVSATTLTSGAHSLPDAGAIDFTGSTASALASTGPTTTCSGSCTLPTNTTAYPVAITTASSTPTAYTVYDTSAGTGMGTMTIGGSSAANPIGWWVQVPASAYAGSYTSSLTFQIVSAP